MALITLDVTTVPFQGQVNFTNTFQNCATQMKLPNNGYTVLFIRVGAVTPTITIYSTQDMASRYGNIGPTLMTANRTISYGPFRPIWWNNQGYVLIELDDATSVTYAAFNYQF
jgi:hypothetical protein